MILDPDMLTINYHKKMGFFGTSFCLVYANIYHKHSVTLRLLVFLLEQDGMAPIR